MNSLSFIPIAAYVNDESDLPIFSLLWTGFSTVNYTVWPCPKKRYTLAFHFGCDAAKVWCDI